MEPSVPGAETLPLDHHGLLLFIHKIVKWKQNEYISELWVYSGFRLLWETSLFPLLTCGKSDVSQPNRRYQNRPVSIFEKDFTENCMKRMLISILKYRIILEVYPGTQFRERRL
ncbi:hypothetical protein AVEN_23192-1 [Araneus ventricosus]|uniref:Uncharacterized protein n=1 Tax=Araneus ventricosus TaxID=182803 RepID=A0A4Y2B1Y2_ARAVE|nr:hypothetical protein AVEN_23192-1 [Araneus ventricosus]